MAVNKNDPHTRFRHAARKVRSCLAENQKLQVLIDEKEYYLAGLRGISYDRLPCHTASSRDDSGRMSMWEQKETLEARRKANAALIDWVFAVMSDIRKINVEDYLYIYSVYICHAPASDMDARVDPDHLGEHTGKVIASVMTEKRIDELDVIEALIAVLHSPVKEERSQNSYGAAILAQRFSKNLRRENVE